MILINIYILINTRSLNAKLNLQYETQKFPLDLSLTNKANNASQECSKPDLLNLNICSLQNSSIFTLLEDLYKKLTNKICMRKEYSRTIISGIISKEYEKYLSFYKFQLKKKI